MRTLVVGAGAVGGYFGGRLAEAGGDVAFLVRPGRAAQLAETGLQIESPHGNVVLEAKTLTPGTLDGSYDVILVCVKSYSLDGAISDIAPAVAGGTSVVPLLNGFGHIARLQQAFGDDRVLGGMCLITATLGPAGEIRHLLEPHELAFGELGGGSSDRVQAIRSSWFGSKAKVRASSEIMQDMWEKFAILATTAGSTCLMRGCFGDILASPGGREAVLRLFSECAAVASAAGFPPRAAFLDFATRLITTEGSALKASMFRDIERGGRTEGEHVFGYMLDQARIHGVAAPTVELARCNVATYENAARREALHAG